MTLSQIVEELGTAFLGPKSTREPPVHLIPKQIAFVTIDKPKTVKEVFIELMQPLGGIGDGTYRFHAAQGGDGVLYSIGRLTIPERGYYGKTALEVIAKEKDLYPDVTLPQTVENNTYDFFAVKNHAFSERDFSRAIKQVAFVFNNASLQNHTRIVYAGIPSQYDGMGEPLPRITS